MQRVLSHCPAERRNAPPTQTRRWQPPSVDRDAWGAGLTFTLSRAPRRHLASYLPDLLSPAGTVLAALFVGVTPALLRVVLPH
jgi:hypothetical protein